MKLNSKYKKGELPEENRPTSDWWDEISEKEKAAIEKGLEDVKAGRLIPHDDMKKDYTKWL